MLFALCNIFKRPVFICNKFSQSLNIELALDQVIVCQYGLSGILNSGNSTSDNAPSNILSKYIVFPKLMVNGIVDNYV
jgi:hypothetical protein